MRMYCTGYNVSNKRQVKTSASARKQRSCAVNTNPNLGTVSMTSNRDGNLRPGKYQPTGSERISGVSQPSKRHRAIQTNQRHVQHDIAKVEVQEIYKLFEALAVFKRTNIEEIKQIMNAEQKILEQRSEIYKLKKQVELMDKEAKTLKAQFREKDIHVLKLNQGRNCWNVEHEQYVMRYNDLQRKYDKIKYESQEMLKDNTTLEKEIQSLKSELRKTEQELSRQKCDISRFKKDVESEGLNVMQLLKQKQGKNWNEQMEPRQHDLQRKYGKIKDEFQAIVMDKTKLENEIETLKSMLGTTKQALLEKTSELSKLKIYVEAVDKKSRSLEAQLQEKDMQLLNQTQGRNWNVEYNQLEMRHKELQRKFDQINNQSQAMVVDKTKLENENEKLRTILGKTEQEVSQQKSEIYILKKHVETVDEELKSLKEQFQETKMQLLNQKEKRNMNVEYEHSELWHKDLQRKFDKIKNENHSMVINKTKLENENEKLRSILMKTEHELSEKTSEIFKLKERIESMDEETKSLKAQLQENEMQLLKQKQGKDLNIEYEQLEMRNKDLQRKLDKIENEKLTAVLRKTEQETLEQKSEISKLKKRVEKMDQELESCKTNLQQKERQLQEQRLATKKAYAEKDDALTRLSRHMGQQMSEGNANITDLSDQNRPSKLGERYSELYDNEWTDAFEGLTDKFDKNEKEAIEVLLTILLESYKRAFDFSISQMKEAEYKLSGSTKGVGPECKRLLKEARKHIDIKQADSLLENVLEALSNVVDRRYLREATVQVFAKECFQLCWFMSIQDPPVALAKEPIQGSHLDTNIYRHYTNSGDTVDYVVWPALLLHKDGPLLTKGVAQPFPKLTPK